jgi:hypothetical protein
MNVLDSGARINGQSDARLQTLKVLDETAPPLNQRRLFAVS